MVQIWLEYVFVPFSMSIYNLDLGAPTRTPDADAA